MSPVDRAVSLTGTNFTLGSYEKFQPGFRDEKRQKTSCGAKFEKQSKYGETQNYNFHAYYSFGNSYSCITTVEWDAYDVENTAGNARRCRIHSKNSSRFHPGNRAEVFIWQNFQPAYRDPGWKNRDLGNRASPPSHMNTSKILQRIQRLGEISETGLI